MGYKRISGAARGLFQVPSKTRDRIRNGLRAKLAQRRAGLRALVDFVAGEGFAAHVEGVVRAQERAVSARLDGDAPDPLFRSREARRVEEVRAQQFWALAARRFEEGNRRAAAAPIVMRRDDNGRPYWWHKARACRIDESEALAAPDLN